MKDVYGYTRVSTTKQGEGVSLEVQKEAIGRYAMQHGLSIVQWFEEKETAAKQGRPIFNAMLKLLKAKKASGLILHKIDRGARNLKDWLELITLSEEKGVKLHFAHESINIQERGGRLAADIQLAVAADYIRNLSQETKKGLDGRLKQGIYPFQAPTGYLDNGKGGKQKTIDPIQAPLVRKAFELYATQKYNLKELTKHMALLGLKNFRGSPMKLAGLNGMLRNPFYIGIFKVRSGVYNGGHIPLIKPVLFNRVQLILTGKYNQKVRKHEFLFRKMIQCAGCGYSLIGEHQKGHTYYRCHTKGCPTKSMRESTLENLILKAFKHLEFTTQEINDLKLLLNEAKHEKSERQKQLISAIKLQMTHIHTKLERLTDCYLEGGLDKTTFELRKEKLLLETKSKEAVEKDLMKQYDKIYEKVEKILELINTLTGTYKKGILEEKQKLVKSITSNLQVNENKLVIAMKSPFLELAKHEEITMCAQIRDLYRIKDSISMEFDTDTPTPIRNPFSKEKLKLLLEEILLAVSLLPEDNDNGYDLSTYHPST